MRGFTSQNEWSNSNATSAARAEDNNAFQALAEYICMKKQKGSTTLDEDEYHVVMLKER